MPLHAVRLFLAPLALLLLAALPARAFDTRAASAYVLDLATGTVLYEKNAEIGLPPASMSKLMTLNMLFEALEDGRLAMDTRLRVSEQAQAMGGSTMFLDTSDRPSVEELIQGIIVLSGNDGKLELRQCLGMAAPDAAHVDEGSGAAGKAADRAFPAILPLFRHGRICL
jgi:D-alanyl-D-alanine carboxypeptidase (penicillin-binding protein 5/6)